MIPSNVGTPLYTVPRGVLGYIRSFVTERVGRTAALACKAFAIADETFLETNSKRIANFVYNPQTELSNLYAMIRPLVDTLNASIGRPPLQNRHQHQLFYDSVRKAIESFGYFSHILVLTCEDIRLLSAPIEETFQDEALLQIWKTISRQLELTPEDLGLDQAVDGDIGALDYTVVEMNAEKIRAWMPENKNRLETIEELDLSGQNLRCLPKEIGFFTGLQKLNLNGNALVTLPSTLANLPDLRSLSASGNRLSQLPLSIGELAKLEVLDLDDNRLTSVPLELGRLFCLKTLSLAHNNLSFPPPQIGELVNLETLDLSSNQLAALPLEFRNLQNLRTLSLSNNQFAEFPPEAAALQNLNVIMDGNPCARPSMEFALGADLFDGLNGAAMELDDELPLGDWLDGESDPKKAKTDE